MMDENIRQQLSEHQLKVTPQRVLVLDAINKLKNHPTADDIIAYIKNEDYPVAVGTVYKVLDTLVKNDLIKKVKTDEEVMRYDGVTKNHHHIYCSHCNYIEDYNNEELDALLKDFFEKHPIENFDIADIKLSINGHYTAHENNNNK